MIARRSPWRRWACESFTGAAFTRFVVKVPAEVEGSSEYTNARSSRSDAGFLMPQDTAEVLNPWGAPTPPLIRVMGKSVAKEKDGTSRLDGNQAECNPAVSGRPNARLKDCTACPPAPFPRLSS